MTTGRSIIFGTIVALLAFGFGRTARAGGLPTLKTILVDGDMADWQEVLVNPVQVSHDGDGSSYGSSCIGSPDRDCEVTGGTGRDLLTFAWTYDLTNVYLYIERWGSSANNIKFYFVMDLDGDARAQATDRVVRVKYFGSDRRTELSLFAYIPADPAGDPLTDGSGFVDGYDMPGNINKSNTLYEHTHNPGGSLDGMKFEELLPWDALNLSAGAPILWHVACGNNDDLTGVVDNIGGPDGGLGTFGFGGVDISPDWVLDAGSPDQIDLAHTITNVGNVDGRFDLLGTSVLGLSLTYWTDPDGDGDPADGTIMAVDANGDGDFADPVDIAPAGADDGNTNGLIDFLLPNLGGQVHLVVRANIPAGLDGAKDFVNLKVQMDSMPSIADTAIDQIYIGNIVIYPDGDRKGMQGEYVYFGHLVANNQATEDIADFVVLSSQGWPVTLYTDVDLDGLPDVYLAADNQGDGTWDDVDLAEADSNANEVPDSGILPSGGAPVGFVLEVAVPVGTAVGTVDITTLTGSSPASGYSGMATDRTTVQERVTLEPDYLFSAGTNLYYGGEGESVYFAYVLTNAWIMEDDFSLSTTSVQDWPVLLWSDPDGNGSIDDGNLIVGPVTAAAMGGTFNLVAEVLIPAGTPIGTQETITITADSLSSDAQDTAVGQLEVRMMQTFRDHLYQFQATNFATCETIYIKAGGLEVGQVGRYEVRYFDPGSQPAGTDALISDARGEAYTSRTLGKFADQGAWTMELWDDLSGLLDQVFIRHERVGLVDPIWIVPGVLVNGADLHIIVGLTNLNFLAPYSESLMRTVVRSPDGTQYLTENGTFQPYSNGESTKISAVIPLAAGDFTTVGFTISSVVLPEVGSGSYTVEVYWLTSCEAQIDYAQSSFTSAGCVVDADCDDQDFCNGQETCNTSIGACQDGAPPVCDDGLDCTVDSCDAAANDCIYVPNHNLCSDGNVCTQDTCDPVASTEPDGCVYDSAAMNGQPCDDGVNCTVDACSAGACQGTPDNGACDDSVGCTDDSCSPGDPGADGNGCLFVVNDFNCDDLLSCTLDTCEPANPLAQADGCVSTPDDAGCDDLQDCTSDSCDPTDPSADSNGCVLIPDHTVCDDASVCTTEECLPVLGCTYTPVADGTSCSDNDVCNGLEACASGVCAPGTTLDCDDSNPCTNDWCNSLIGCRHTNNTSPCDDDEYCNGPDSCDGSGNCSVHAGNPCGTLFCIEASETCVGCVEDDDCPVCTQCIGGTCLNQPAGSDLKEECPADACKLGSCDGQGACQMQPADTACGDGTETECNHADSCDGAGNCRLNIEPAGAPCGDLGIECLADDSCDGEGSCVDQGFQPAGTACGDQADSECDHPDSCDSGVCLPNLEPSGSACGDPTETDCDLADSCEAGTCQPNLVSAGATCGDQGIDCLVDDTCDGAGGCTDNGLVPNGTSCGDQTETDCDHADGCLDGVCHPNFEDSGVGCGDQGVDCLLDDACDGSGECLDAGFAADGSACGDSQQDDCNHADSCLAGVCQPNLEADGAVCGDQSQTECDAPDSCLAGVCEPNYAVIWTPCGDLATECLVDDACDGAGSCTDNGFLPDGIACGDSAESECDLPDTCLAGVCAPNHLGAGEACGDQEVDCLVDDSCDGAGSCTDGGFEPAGTSCEDPQDTLFCDGEDSCDGGGTCLEGGNPCPGQMCDEASDSCTECLQDADCSDDVFCNGQEVCQDGVCQPGDDPCDDGIDCTEDTCNETDDSCSNQAEESLCDDDDVCTLDDCDPGSGCVNTFQDSDLDGVCDALDPCPDDASDGCEDSDDDGIPDDQDPCPDDPTNTCEGFVTGGGYGCATTRSSSGSWISLVMLIGCVLGLARRRKN